MPFNSKSVFLTLREMVIMLNSSETEPVYAISSFNRSVTTPNMSDSNMTIETPDLPFYMKITSTLFFAIIFLFGVFGNVLVILVVCWNRNMKTSVNIYLMNLCVADILVLTVCMPTVLVDVYARDVWYFGKTMCYVVPFLENTVTAASVLTLIAISTERYRVICQPLKGIRDDVSKIAKIVPLIWTLCALSNIPWFYVANYRDSEHLDGTPIKVCRNNIHLMWHRVYVVSLCFLYFVLPFSVLLILYCRICYILQSTDADAPNGSLKESSHCRNRRNLRIQVLNIIVCLVVLFFLFHLPYRVVSMWFIFANKEDLRDLGIETYFNVLYAARTLFYLNHSINPIIYNFVSTKFRNTLRGMISREDCQASIVSCHRRPGNTPFIRHKQSHHSLMIDHNMDKSSLIIKRTQVTRTSRRQKMNEFFPMYATVLQKQNDVDCGQC